MLKGLQKIARSYLRSRRGAVAVLVAALAIPLVAITGIALDTARGYLLKARLSQALDAAALAGGRVFFQPQRDSDIQMYFDANFPAGYMEAELGDLQISENVEEGTLSLSIDARLDTTFMRVVGINDMDVAAASTVKRADRGLELALVMDNTGSMYSHTGGERKVEVMKGAALELVSSLYGERDEVANLYISLVPYTAVVNVGDSHEDWLVEGVLHGDEDDDDGGQQCVWTPWGLWCWGGGGGGGDDDDGLDYGDNGWKGCVEARESGRDVTDDPPSVAKFQPYHYEPHDIDNDWPPIDESEQTNTTSNSGTGPNLGCGPAITPLTQNRGTIEDNIYAMDSWHRGGTTTNLGLVWGWRTISPRWRGLWGGGTPAEMPFDYDEPLMDKVVVVLTDGYNQLYSAAHDHYHHYDFTDSDYTAYDRLSEGRLGTTTSFSTARQELNDRTTDVCDAMKAEGIVIYTITFAVANNSGGNAIRDIFRDCASNPGYYFDSPTAESLRATFRAIASQLSNLRIYK